jgi:hypothetical protein
MAKLLALVVRGECRGGDGGTGCGSQGHGRRSARIRRGAGGGGVCALVCPKLVANDKAGSRSGALSGASTSSVHSAGRMTGQTVGTAANPKTSRSVVLWYAWGKGSCGTIIGGSMVVATTRRKWFDMQ